MRRGSTRACHGIRFPWKYGGIIVTQRCHWWGRPALHPQTYRQIGLTRDRQGQNSEGSALILPKQSLQYTGRSPLGRKGTIASLPHSAQTIGYISRGWSEYMPPRCSVRRTARQLRQRLGSLENPRALKNSCSPAVNMNSPPHSTHIKVLSDSATGRPPCDHNAVLVWPGRSSIP